MLPAPQMSALVASGCEVAFDNLTRQLYATDASPYQIESTGNPPALPEDSQSLTFPSVFGRGMRVTAETVELLQE